MERHRQGVCLGLQELPRKRGVCVVGGQPGQSKGQTARPEQQGFLFHKLRACCNKAYDERIIAHNPIRGIEGIKAEEGKRMYLTIDEVRLLARTECHYPSVKRAFLFSCLTGLRRSDIERLKWKDVYAQDNFTRIIFNQKKTNGLEYLDLAPEAVELMGERGKPDDNVFDWINSPHVTNSTLREWCMGAGIKKHITFHSGRHTFATMLLTLGADLYTVCKLLGHSDVKTTQIYAKIINKKKEDAISLIDMEFANT